MELERNRNSIMFRNLSPDEGNDVFMFLAQHYYHREPTSLMLQMTEEDGAATDKAELKVELSKNASIAAVDLHTGVLCGVIVNTLGRQNYAATITNPLDHPSSVLQGRFYDYMMKDIEENLGTDNFLVTEFLCVPANYCKMGIAKEMLRRSEAIAKKRGYGFMAMVATSSFSQQLAKSAGFVVSSTVQYRDYVDHVTKQKPFTKLIYPHFTAQLMLKSMN